MLKKSKDTCLLQYALMTRGHLNKEANRQASQFKHRFFLEGNDHIYHHRQIVALPIRPVFIRFCAPNFALIAFVDHSIWLVDLSTGYTVSPMWFDGHKDTVCDIQMLSGEHFVSLDRKGMCHVWSLKNSPINRKRANSTSDAHLATSNASDIRNGIRQNRAESFDKHRKTPQTPQQTLERPGHIIQCVTLVYGVDAKTVERIILGTESGQISICNWSLDDNRIMPEIHENTSIGPIHAIVAVRRNFLIVLSKAGILWRMKMKNMAVTRLDGMPLSEIIEPVVGLHELSDQTFSSATSDADCLVLVVYANRVFRVTLSHSTAQLQEAHELYAPPFDCNLIICSVLSNDRNYLIMGTERGIVVFDMNDEQVILRRSVSDIITCVDIHSLNTVLYRYVLMCGTQNERFSYVYGLEAYGHGSLMQWSPDRMGSPLLGDGQLNTWLLGGRLFYVTDIDEDTDTFWFAGVDSQGVIHRKCSADEFQRSERIHCENGTSKIQAFATGGQMVFVGCSDGAVYDSLGKKLMQLKGPVTFLRYFHERLILAGSQSTFRMSPFDMEVNSRELAEAYLIGDGRFVLMVLGDATFKVGLIFYFLYYLSILFGNPFCRSSTWPIEKSFIPIWKPLKTRSWVDAICWTIDLPWPAAENCSSGRLCISMTTASWFRGITTILCCLTRPVQPFVFACQPKVSFVPSALATASFSCSVWTNAVPSLCTISCSRTQPQSTPSSFRHGPATTESPSFWPLCRSSCASGTSRLPSTIQPLTIKSTAFVIDFRIDRRFFHRWIIIEITSRTTNSNALARGSASLVPLTNRSCSLAISSTETQPSSCLRTQTLLDS